MDYPVNTIKQTTVEKYYQVVRSAYHIFHEKQQNMSHVEFKSMHNIASIAVDYLLRKSVVRYKENGLKKAKWNVMIKPSIELAQEMLDRSRNYNKSLVPKPKKKVSKKIEANESVEDIKYIHLKWHYPHYNDILNGGRGNFAKLSKTIKKDIFDISGKSISHNTAMSLANIYIKDKHLDIDLTKVETYVVTKALSKQRNKLSEPQPVDLFIKKEASGNEIKLDNYIELNKRIVDNKNLLNDHFEIIKSYRESLSLIEGLSKDLAGQVGKLNLDNETSITLYSHMKDNVSNIKDDVSDLKDVVEDMSVEFAVSIPDNKSSDSSDLDFNNIVSNKEKIPYIYQFLMGTGFIYTLYLVDTIINFILSNG
tara:strand:- start:13034 stop:14131 length:1098 start_codon:yes stop_codon:yes gene_type:complete